MVRTYLTVENSGEKAVFRRQTDRHRTGQQGHALRHTHAQAHQRHPFPHHAPRRGALTSLSLPEATPLRGTVSNLTIYQFCVILKLQACYND